MPRGLPVPTLRARIRSPRPSAAAAAPTARSPGWSSSAAIVPGDAAARRAQAARGHVELRRPPRARQRALERRRLGERRRVAAGDVDRALDGELGPGDEEAAHERRRVAAAEPPHDRVAIARGGPRAADALQQRLGLGLVADARDHQRAEAPAAEVDERGGRLVAQPRADVALEVERPRRGRDRLQRGVARGAVAGELRCERVQPARGRIGGVGVEPREGERRGRHQLGGVAARPGVGPHVVDGDPHDRQQQGHGPRQERAAHSPRRRCWRSTKSITSGIPSSA